MFGVDIVLAHIEIAKVQAAMERELVTSMQKSLSPEQFEKWQADRIAERRHREICRAIEQAGHNARPKGTIIGFGHFS